MTPEQQLRQTALRNQATLDRNAESLWEALLNDVEIVLAFAEDDPEMLRDLSPEHLAVMFRLAKHGFRAIGQSKMEASL